MGEMVSQHLPLHWFDFRNDASMETLLQNALVQLLALLGALYTLSVFYGLFPRVRVGLDSIQASRPLHVKVLSSDATSSVYAGLIQRFRNSKSVSLSVDNNNNNEGNDGGGKSSVDNVMIVSSDDLLNTTQLLKQTLSEQTAKNIVLVEVIKRDDKVEADLSAEDSAIHRISQYGNHAYFRTLVEGLGPEYPATTIRLCTIENDVMENPTLAEELEEFLRIPSVPYVRMNRNELTRPKVYRLHAVLILVAMVTFIVFGLPGISVMDPESMKPRKGFNPTLKAIAIATNVPIKLGVVHGILYAFEFFLDPNLFKRHVGQRLTTLWFQLFQFQRFGQHLQMHIETLVQAADVLTSKSPLARHTVVKVFLYVVIAGVLTQNALTSLGWHSLKEQAIGFGLGMLKLVAFDLAPHGARLNRYLGESLARGIQWLGGAISLGGGLFLNNYAPLHPTIMASLIFAGGAVTLLVLLGLRGGFRSGGLSRIADM